MKKNTMFLTVSVLVAMVTFGQAAERASTGEALPRLLDLGADKCIPCKKMAPILEEMKETFAGQMQVDFIDVWKNPKEAPKCSVTTIPTQIFLSD
ncbi:MAG: thioredoxin family protein [Planctomycetes bacterium]|nr:thioredoxin family protein [Planctomycetota bacterium]